MTRALRLTSEAHKYFWIEKKISWSIEAMSPVMHEKYQESPWSHNP